MTDKEKITYYKNILYLLSEDSSLELGYTESDREPEPCVLCNDFFLPAADGEDVSVEDVAFLVKLWDYFTDRKTNSQEEVRKKYSNAEWAFIAWVAIRRGEYGKPWRESNADEDYYLVKKEVEEFMDKEKQNE